VSVETLINLKTEDPYFTFLRNKVKEKSSGSERPPSYFLMSEFGIEGARGIKGFDTRIYGRMGIPEAPTEIGSKEFEGLSDELKSSFRLNFAAVLFCAIMKCIDSSTQTYTFDLDELGTHLQYFFTGTSVRVKEVHAGTSPMDRQKVEDLAAKDKSRANFLRDEGLEAFPFLNSLLSYSRVYSEIKKVILPAYIRLSRGFNAGEKISQEKVDEAVRLFQSLWEQTKSE